MNTFRTTAFVPADHPCLAGHFPGRPIVPAVVLLEQVELALRKSQGRLARVTALPSVKFLHPLAPGLDFEIVLELDTGTRSARFRCSLGERELAQGRLEYAA
jgi:3-hydroxyacyl-[acyl-carrier-protein] dehydratase